MAKSARPQYARAMDSFNDLTSAATLLATRRSGKARDLVAPGPDAAQLRTILTSAMRVPDHGKLAPWRFVTIGDDRREALSAAMVAAYVADKPDAGRLEIDAIRNFALEAPCLVVVMARPFLESHIPEWEQQLSAGAVCGMLCAAVHANGFVANWLTGWPAYAPGVARLFAEPGERIAGYFFIGTPSRPLDERPRPIYEDVVRVW